jgi:hypothetical protein
MNRRGFLKGILTAGVAPHICTAVSAPMPSRQIGMPVLLQARPPLPFDLPLPDYEVPIPVKDGYLHIKGAFNAIDAAGRKGQSFTMRLPEGPVTLPPQPLMRSREWYIDWNGRHSEETCIALVGAKNGTSHINGTAESNGGVLRFVGAGGLWRIKDFAFSHIRGDAFSFGTGLANLKKCVVVFENLKGRYIRGRFFMRSCEWRGDIVRPRSFSRAPLPAVSNDETWISDCDVRYQTGSHLLYADNSAYMFARRCKFGAGGNHIFKDVSRRVDVEDCIISNADPDTLRPHTIGPGQSPLWPDGKTFLGDSAPVNFHAESIVHAKRLKVYKVWPTGFSDGGSAAITRQVRWALHFIDPELVNPSSRDYWVAAKAAGIDKPDNPYLFPALFESCHFENWMDGRSPTVHKRYVVVNQGSYPTDSYDGKMHPLLDENADPLKKMNHPELWFERARDFMFDCKSVNFYAPWMLQVPWGPRYPEIAGRVTRHEPIMFQQFDAKPASRSRSTK